MDGSHPKRPAPKEDEAGSLGQVGGTAQFFGRTLRARKLTSGSLVAALRPPLKMARTMSSSSASSMSSYTPPDNFALVTGMVYRSSFPKPENLPYLKKLGLKTVL